MNTNRATREANPKAAKQPSKLLPRPNMSAESLVNEFAQGLPAVPKPLPWQQEPYYGEGEGDVTPESAMPSEWLEMPVNTPVPQMDEETWYAFTLRQGQRTNRDMWKLAMLITYGDKRQFQTLAQLAHELGMAQSTIYNITKTARHLSAVDPKLLATVNFWSLEPIADKQLPLEEKENILRQVGINGTSQKVVRALVKETKRQLGIKPPEVEQPQFTGPLADERHQVGGGAQVSSTGTPALSTRALVVECSTVGERKEIEDTLRKIVEYRKEKSPMDATISEGNEIRMALDRRYRELTGRADRHKRTR